MIGSEHAAMASLQKYKPLYILIYAEQNEFSLPNFKQKMLIIWTICAYIKLLKNYMNVTYPSSVHVDYSAYIYLST